MAKRLAKTQARLLRGMMNHNGHWYVGMSLIPGPPSRHREVAESLLSTGHVTRSHEEGMEIYRIHDPYVTRDALLDFFDDERAQKEITNSAAAVQQEYNLRAEAKAKAKTPE